VPGTNGLEDGYDYIENRFNSIYSALNGNLFIKNIYEILLNIIQEMHGFVRSYSCAEGLPERYFEINLNLKYYRIGFKLQTEDEEAYKPAVDKGMLSYILAAHEFIAKELNFSNT